MPDTDDILASEGHHDIAVVSEQAAAADHGPIEWHAGFEIEALGTLPLRNDYRINVIDLEDKMPTPRRATSKVTVEDTTSFVDFVNRFPTERDATVIYVGRGAAQATAIFNDNGRDPGWRDHRATLNWAKTDEWKRWTKNDRQLMKQEDFAELIEDGLSEIVDPDAADLLEIAQTVKGLMSVNIVSARYLQDGSVKVGYDETIDVSGGRSGDMTIPSHFTLQMAPFEGGTPITITARLRYRLVGKQISFGYILDRPKDKERVALDSEISLIASGCPDVLIVMGDPG